MMALKLIEHGSILRRTYIYMCVCVSVYIFLSVFFIQQEKTFLSFFFTVYPCRVCEQTNGEQGKREQV